MSSDFNLNWGRVLLSVIAPADSLHGQLQRGRGRGYLSALREDVAEVRPLLLDCLLHDPRWDRQLEPRSDYYAQLAMRTALPLDPLQAYLHERTQIEPADPNDLVLNTLCALAVRDYIPAIAIVRDYLSYGECWDIAFESLVMAPSDAIAMDEVSRILDARFPDDNKLADELPTAGPGMHTQREPWRSLRAVNPRVDRILATSEREAERRERSQQQIIAPSSPWPAPIHAGPRWSAPPTGACNLPAGRNHLGLRQRLSPLRSPKHTPAAVRITTL